MTASTALGNRIAQHSWARYCLAIAIVAATMNPVQAQFETAEPFVLPAERGLDTSAVYSADRMESQAQMSSQLQNLKNQNQMMQNQLDSQQAMLESQPEQPPMLPQATGTPQPNGDWIELQSPLNISNDGVMTNNVINDGNTSNQGTFENGLTFSNDTGDGSGYVYSDGCDDGFWSGLDCDCRKCRRRHVTGKCWDCCQPEFGGWLAGGFYRNAHGSRGSLGNTPLGFNNIYGAQLNQAWMYVQNPVERGNGWDFGYRMDFMFGADGPDTQAFGDGKWDDGWDTSGQYGFAMPQLYVEGAYGNTSIRAGHFFTMIGYEVVTAPDNFFYSHAYTMYYNEPFTHTGILATHDWSDDWTVYLGYTFGWDTGFTNVNDGATFLGGISWSPSDYFSVTYATTVGDPGDNPVGASDTYMHSIVVDTVLTDNLEWVVQSDFQNRQSAVLDGRSYGLVNYLFYQWSDCTSFGLRHEWFRDSRGLAGVAGASEHFHSITLGMNRQITDRLMLRPEVRFDWADRDDGFAGRAFDRGTENSQLTLGSQAVWVW